jgi:antitoxin component YwqK of YwqJK toxin-antitoxin module
MAHPDAAAILRWGILLHSKLSVYLCGTIPTRMRTFAVAPLLTVLSISLLISCGKTEKLDEAFAGYKLESIEGTDLQVAKKWADTLLLEEVYLKNGKPHGTWTIYHDQNMRIKDHKSYYDGELNGYWLQFNQLGRVEIMEHYKKGVLHGARIKYYSGFPLEIESYENGKPHGIFKKYYPNKNLQQESTYKNGILDGPFRYYNEDGKLSLEYQYENGEKKGGGIIE